MMRSHTLTLIFGFFVAVLAIGLSESAHAYLTPEEVLFHQDLYAPPSPREVDARVEAQRQRSEARRNAAQVGLDPEPEPEAPAEEEDAEQEAAPGEGEGMTDDETSLNSELLRTIRLLNRIGENQEKFVIGGDDAGLHGGAPLAPTGAGTVLAVLTVLGASFVTYRRAVKASKAF